MEVLPVDYWSRAESSSDDLLPPPPLASVVRGPKGYVMDRAREDLPSGKSGLAEYIHVCARPSQQPHVPEALAFLLHEAETHRFLEKQSRPLVPLFRDCYPVEPSDCPLFRYRRIFPRYVVCTPGGGD